MKRTNCIVASVLLVLLGTVAARAADAPRPSPQSPQPATDAATEAAAPASPALDSTHSAPAEVGGEPSGRVAEAAAEEPTPQPMHLQCELKFESSAEPWVVSKNEWSPDLFDKRYVAVFRQESATVSLPMTQGMDRWLQQERGMHPVQRTGVFRDWPFVLQGNNSLYRQFLNGIPVEKRPSPELLDSLFRFGSMRRDQEDNRGRRGVFRIYAPTPERVKELVQAYLDLFDYGAAFPIQEAFVKAIEQTKSERSQLRNDLEAANATLADLEKQLDALKDYRDIRKEDLTTYRTQQRLLEVELAGVQARIEAIKNAGANAPRKNADSSRLIQQLDELKTTAEIDLASVKARQTAVAAIVQNGENFLELSATKVQAASKVRALGQMISEQEKRLAQLTDNLHAWQKCPVIDGKVVIRPVTFEGATPASSAAPTSPAPPTAE